MPIRIKLFLIILSVSLIPPFFLTMIIPNFPEVLFMPVGTPFLLMFFIIVILIAFISLIVAIHFTLPLTYLREIALKVQAGDLSQRANIKKQDEIGELALVFNTMLDSLQNQRSTLQNTVTQATRDLDEKVKSLEDTKMGLEKQKMKDEAILASIGDGLIAIDEYGKIIIINQVGLDLLMYKKEEMLGKKLVDLVGMVDKNGNVIPGDKRPAQMSVSHSQPTSTTTEPAYYYIRKDKTQLPVAITVTPVISNNQTIGAIEVFRDISKELEMEKAKNEFVSLASHQLRTPLGIIKWYLEAFENEDYFRKAPEVIKKYFDEVYKSNERILSLVRDLLSVSRIDQGRVKNVPESVNITATVKEIVEQMQIVAGKKSVALHLTIPDSKFPTINIDVLRLHEVIENLIANAIEYTPDSGTVDVIIQLAVDNKNLLQISVKDSGIGISGADQKKLFTKFFRTEKAIASNPEGSGLGLYLVKSYVEGWGGKISIESHEGKGSTFTIYLPFQST